MSLLLLLGFSGSVLAAVPLLVDDPAGDTAGGAVTAYDIDKADVFVYPDGAGIEEYLTVGVEMDTSIPGMFMFEFSVDDNDATGGSQGMPHVFKSCEGGTKIYEPGKPGFDILIMLMLRKTTIDAGTAFCDACVGPGAGQCFVRNTTCAGGCGTSDCYDTNAGGSCAPDSGPDCYLANDRCMDLGIITCESCYELTEVCGTDHPCGIGRRLGEWYANNTIGIGGGESAARGRIDLPLPKGTDETGRAFYTFPWKRIVEAVHATCLGSPGCFDLTAAADSTNIKWQVSSWYNADFPIPPADDFFPGDGLPCAAVTDVIPNDGMASAKTTPDSCNGDFEPDEDVDGTDAFKFKSDFGRDDCL